jgi:hypothetical protein
MINLGRGVALLIPGLLVLSACSSPTSAPQRASTTESVRIGPYTQVFATGLPAGRAQAGVVSGFRQAQILWERSNNAWRLVAPVTDYVTGRALTELTAAIAAGRQRHLVPSGTDRFFRTRVAALSGASATVVTCDDGSKFREQDPRTGQVDEASAPRASQSYLFETWQLVRHAGHWAIASFTLTGLPASQARACQPAGGARTLQ